MKPKFKVGDAVCSPTNTGTVKQVGTFADHYEYFVEWPDKTGNWIAESALKPNPLKPQLNPQ